MKTFFLVILLSCCSPLFADCFTEAFKEVQNEALNFKEIETYAKEEIKFHCQESSLIDDLKEPYLDSNKMINALKVVLDDARIFHHYDSWMDIFSPYCRKGNLYFEQYCMATDIHSAWTILNDAELIKKLPRAIKLLGDKISSLPYGKKFDLIEELSPLFEKNKEGQIKKTLLASFIGLDDNGVQILRLLANLLYEKNYKDYAALYLATAQYPNIITKKNGTFNVEISKIYFSTRLGQATLKFLEEKKYTKTYKLYSSIYFGCQMALEKEGLKRTKRKAYLAGMSYEMMKLSPSKNILKVLPKSLEDSKEVGTLMSQGAEVGYKACY